MHQPRRTRLLVVVPAALMAVSLTGCGLAEDAVKDQIEDAAKSEGVELDLDDPSNIGVDTTDGGLVTGELPKGFPTDQVPVVDGEILAGTYTNNPKTWNATVQVGPAGGDKAAAYAEAEAALLGADLTTVTEKYDNGASIVGQYATDEWLVDLAVTDSNGIVVNYLVSPKT